MSKPLTDTQQWLDDLTSRPVTDFYRPHGLEAFPKDIQKASESIRTYLGDTDFQAFHTNRLLTASVERKFSIVGEAIRPMVYFFPNETARTINHGAVMTQAEIRADLP